MSSEVIHSDRVSETKNAKKMFDNLQQLSSKSNLSTAQGTKRLPKFLTSNICTCIYILNVRVCIQLHGYYILKPTLCLQYCMHKCIESLRLKDLRYWGLKKLAVGTSNSLWYAIIRYWSSVACDAMMSSLLRYWYWSTNRATIKDLQLLWF